MDWKPPKSVQQIRSFLGSAGYYRRFILDFSSSKVQEVMDLKPPKSIHQIRSFLGLAGYCRQFIPDFSRITKPMTELLKKGVKFVWSEACEKAFHMLR
jgi:hypothetical protein